MGRRKELTMRNSVLGNILILLVGLNENYLGPVYDLVEKMIGKNGNDWFEAFKKFLRKENPWGTLYDWKVWKTIKLGTGLKTAEQFIKALDVYGYKASDWAKGLLSEATFRASVALQEIEVDLVKVSVAELGFADGAYLKDIYKCALKQGLWLCPAEVGPQLHLQYKDPPKDEWLRIAMEAISGSNTCLYLFEVGRDSGGLYLRGCSGHPDDFYRGNCRFVFVRRKVVLRAETLCP